MNPRQATLALVAVTLIWGFSFSGIKALLRDVSPLLGVGIRFGAAALILAPMLRGLRRLDVEAGLVIGALFAAGVAFQNVGLEITTPSRSAFLVSVSAILTPAVAALVLRQRVERSVVVRIAMAMAGVYLLTAPTGSLSDVNRGDWLTMIAAVVFAGHIVAVGHYTGVTSTPRVLSIKFALTALVGFAGMNVVEVPRFEPTVRAMVLLILLISSVLLTFTLQLRSQRVVSASEAALIFTFEPVAAAIVSYFAFGEVLSPIQMVGGLVILLAIGWPRRARQSVLAGPPSAAM